ncbi:CubicO group peptidase (beta-lactamase class C family) [Catenulispora sp. GP43]|uniref:serine hydrolase domain-containing protein n=1 Tax=Catenulispora sp. GP43 TaxID=3156263 RepID=UPI00351407AC
MAPAPHLDQDALQTLHRTIAARVERGELPGAVTLVARVGDSDDSDSGEQVDIAAFGETAPGSGHPMARDTPFRITSMTKPIVAAAVLAMVDAGVLELDAPVDPYLPELADRRVLKRLAGPLDQTVPAERPITVRDLLTFRLGLGMNGAPPAIDPPIPINLAAEERGLVLAQPEPRARHAPDEWLRLFGELPLLEQPGTRWRYNVGSLVQGVLLARAAGAPLEDVVEEHILGPLGMTATGFSVPEEQARRLPAYYATDFTTGKLTRQPADPWQTWAKPAVFPSGAAGLISTLDDYYAFARMLLRRGEHEGRRVLSAESVTLMTTNQLTPDQVAEAPFPLDGAGWGMGMSVTAEGRYGWDGGWGTSWCNDPDLGLCSIFLSQTTDVIFNGTTAEFDALARQAAV